MERPTTTMEMPLHPQIALDPFEKWGIDFIRPIDPPFGGCHHIIVCTDYVTKWAEVRALLVSQVDKVANFFVQANPS